MLVGFAAKQMMLAVGDSGGTLHILEIPWNLSHPASNEVSKCDGGPSEKGTASLHRILFIMHLSECCSQKWVVDQYLSTSTIINWPFSNLVITSTVAACALCS